MSLTSQLRNPQSHINQWFNRVMNPQAASAWVHRVNLTLAQRQPIADYDAHPATIGGAFDYAFRWHIDPVLFSQTTLVAHRNILGIVDKRQRVIIDHLTSIPYGTDDCYRATIVLAWYEQIMRSGTRHDAIENYKNITDVPAYVSRLFAAVPECEWRDVQNLCATIDTVWQDKPRQPFIPNPTFTLSEHFGGADADWIMGTTLYDAKCSWKRRPCTLDMLKQVVAYYFLDKGRRDIQALGLYFPRHQVITEWPIDALISDIDDKRASFYEVAAKTLDAYTVAEAYHLRQANPRVSLTIGGYGVRRITPHGDHYNVYIDDTLCITLQANATLAAVIREETD